MAQPYARRMAAWIAPRFSVRAEAGQGLVEYALILVLVSMVAIVAVRAIGVSVEGLYTQITAAL